MLHSRRASRASDLREHDLEAALLCPGGKRGEVGRVGLGAFEVRARELEGGGQEEEERDQHSQFRECEEEDERGKDSRRSPKEDAEASSAERSSTRD